MNENILSIHLLVVLHLGRNALPLKEGLGMDVFKRTHSNIPLNLPSKGDLEGC
jgi:hypothetical protein